MVGSSCIANIGPGQRRRRLWVGILGLASTGLLLAWLLMEDAPRVLRLLVAAPAWIAAIGFLQHRERT